MQVFQFDLLEKTVTQILNVKQGDVGRKFRAVITEGGAAYSIPAGVQFSVWFSGPGGMGNYSAIGTRSAFEVQENTVTVELITQMLANAGTGAMCLVMNAADGSQLGLWNMVYAVESVPGMGSETAESYYTALSEAATQAIAAAETFKNTGELSGWLKFVGDTTGIAWTTADGTKFRLRPYTGGNVLQIVRVDKDGKEHATVDINNEGQVAFGEKALPIGSGGTGVRTLNDLKTLLGITRRVYAASGEIFSSQGGGTTRGSGRATVHITPDGVARIDYAVQITAAGSVSGVFGVGIDAALLTTLNANIPTITPLAGGIYTCYDPAGTLRTGLTGLGGSHGVSGSGWAMGRIYTADGAFGVWADANFSAIAGCWVVGTCYGTVNI